MEVNRRKFIRLSAGFAVFGPEHASLALTQKEPAATDRILNAYYFRAHTYTLVPSQVREDMKWMSDLGTNAVTVAILEQDLFAAVENIRIIAEEAAKQGMKIFAVPSRWGGLVAGAPKVPSLFSVVHPDTWILGKDGKPAYNRVSGVISSVYHPETLAFFKESLAEMLRLWPISGIVWDEPKCFIKDYSKAALEKNPEANWNRHVEEVASFFGELNTHLKSLKPEILTSLFLYAQEGKETMEKMAGIRDLDYFGCDGRPWSEADGGEMEAKGKSLTDKGDAFISSALSHGKKPLFLIENHNLKSADLPRMEKGLPSLLEKPLGQLIYYYYPRNVEKPEESMAILRKALRNSSWK